MTLSTIRPRRRHFRHSSEAMDGTHRSRLPSKHGSPGPGQFRYSALRSSASGYANTWKSCASELYLETRALAAATLLDVIAGRYCSVWTTKLPKYISFKDKLTSLLQAIGIVLPETQMNSIIEARNSLVHAGKFVTTEADTEYRISCGWAEYALALDRLPFDSCMSPLKSDCFAKWRIKKANVARI